MELFRFIERSFNDAIIKIIVYFTTNRIKPMGSYNKEIRSGISTWAYEVSNGFKKTLLGSG